MAVDKVFIFEGLLVSQLRRLQADDTMCIVQNFSGASISYYQIFANKQNKTTYILDPKGVRDSELAFYIDECAVSNGGCCHNTATGYRC